MSRDYSRYDPRFDSNIVRNHRRLAKENLGLELDNVSDEEIYRIYDKNCPFETPRHDEYYFLQEVAELYGDENHPWFAENDPDKKEH